jgi:pilus assembly protein CpaF
MDRAALHSQLAAAVQVVLHCRRDAGGRRTLAEIAVLERPSGDEVVVVPAWRDGWGPGADRLRALLERANR